MKSRCIFLVVLLLLLAGCGSEPPARLRIGDAVPDFTLPKLGGGELQGTDLAGHVVVLNFWATWCPPCLHEIPVFKRLDEEGVRIVGIALDEEGERAVRPFIEKHGLTYPLISDTDGNIAKAYGVARLGGVLAGWIPPRRVTFVIDGKGVVRRVIEAELNAGTHVDGALAALRDLGAGT